MNTIYYKLLRYFVKIYFVAFRFLRQPIINALHGYISVGSKVFWVPLNA